MVDDNKQQQQQQQPQPLLLLQQSTTTNRLLDSTGSDIHSAPEEDQEIGTGLEIEPQDDIDHRTTLAVSSMGLTDDRDSGVVVTGLHRTPTPSVKQTQFCKRCSRALNDDDDEVVPTADDGELLRLRADNDRLDQQNRRLQQELDRLGPPEDRQQPATAAAATSGKEAASLESKIVQLEGDLKRSAETVAALKADRKKLKAEKFELLSQMRQLYGTLEDKEKELRDFIRNYEQRMKEVDHHQLQVLGAAGEDRSPSSAQQYGGIVREDSEHQQHLIVRGHIVANDLDEVSTTTLTTTSASFCVIQHTETETETTLVRQLQLQEELTDHQVYVQQPSPLLDCSEYSDIRSGVVGSSSIGSKINGYHALSAAVGSPVDVTKLSPSPPIVDVDNGPIYANTMSPGIVGSTSTLDVCHAEGFSRSTEELTHALGTLDLKRRSGTLQRRSNGHGSKGGTWGSISKVFSRGRSRRSVDPSSTSRAESVEKRTSWSPHDSLCASPLTEETYGEKLRHLEEARVLPMDAWRAPMVQAWLELSMGMHLYGPICAENIKSGKVLLELNDAELEAGLRMTNPMHRRKLRLAIEEFREPSSCKYPKASELSHVWVCNEWLPSLGLSQYVDSFALHLVDARVLDNLSKKDMEKYLGMTRKFHQASLAHAIQLQRMVGFDQQILAERRSMCEQTDGDPLVWTNQRFIQWARSVDLAEYADHLQESGVHGAVVVLEPSFTPDAMATALGIPQSKNIIRRHLTTELESIVHPARVLLEQEYFHDRQLTKKDKYSIGSLGRSFSQSYAGGLPGSDGRRSSLRGSLTRALGLKVKQDLQRQQQQQHHYQSSPHHPSSGHRSTTPSQASAVASRTQQQQQQQQPQCRPRSSQIPTRSKPPTPSNRVYSAPPTAGSSSSSAAPSSTLGSSRSMATGQRSASSTSSSPSTATSSSTATAAAATHADASHRRIKSSGDIDTTNTTAITPV